MAGKNWSSALLSKKTKGPQVKPLLVLTFIRRSASGQKFWVEITLQRSHTTKVCVTPASTRCACLGKVLMKGCSAIKEPESGAGSFSTSTGGAHDGVTGAP